ncbi:hypothetical protein SEPCBS57363_006074 [Sporothrix epigloea]|uniref:Dynamin family protein n=1 Tax=Sporothrix epigloea TaxID=1892477 RepID=A0ABP0E125_9PEZI
MGSINIQSQEYRDLLDVVDKLRFQGLDRYVPLPEIVVCGDQSSGKSSVLEAISGLSFPSKDSLCTRFATELVLRRHHEASIAVSILPHHSRSDAEKASLQTFHAELDATNPDIGPVIEAAKAAMGLVDGNVTSGKHFSNDVLRIEMSGPTQQHLTLVDLPGLFHSGGSGQSATDAHVVRQLVMDYIKRRNSIILVVVSAAYEFVNQLATQLAREVDPRGTRTMGLITKPDKLDDRSDREQAFIKMAMNRDVVLQLGWHVLRNRCRETRNATREERDANEKLFFTKPGSPWLVLPSDHLGVGTLRPRLSTVLMNQILAQLAPILEDVKAQSPECEQGLARLGASRATSLKQRQYLSRISNRLTELLTAAVQGNYTDATFFGNVVDDTYSKIAVAEGCQRRLRAVVQNRLTLFAKEMHDRGKTCIIIDEDDKKVEVSGSHEYSEDEFGRSVRNEQGNEHGAVKTNHISRSVYMNEVENIILNSRGRELPGMFNPLVITDLFRQQSRNWGKIAKECVESIMLSSFALVSTALEHIAVDNTAKMIKRNLTDPAMTDLRKDMLAQLEVILQTCNECHPITYNHYLADTVQKLRNKRLRKQTIEVVKKHPRYYSNESAERLADLIFAETVMMRVAASDAIDYMEAYYKVALKMFIDNVSVLVVEQCLVSKLPSLFTPDTIYSFSDKEIARLAGEDEHATAERSRLMEKRKCLQECEADLRLLDRRPAPSITAIRKSMNPRYATVRDTVREASVNIRKDAEEMTE